MMGFKEYEDNVTVYLLQRDSLANPQAGYPVS